MSSADDNQTTTGQADKQPSEKDSVDFHGAAIIGEDGREIPITEDMIKDACRKLDPEADDADDDAS